MELQGTTDQRNQGIKDRALAGLLEEWGSGCHCSAGDKNEDLFFKSQISLAETCEEESPESYSRDTIDEDSLCLDC